MDVLVMIESTLCALYVTITAPIVRLGNAWMERMERLKVPDEAGAIREEHIASNHPEPTVSDIQPQGYIQVMAMGAGGKWEALHDYPVRLLPPYIKLVNDKGEAVR